MILSGRLTDWSVADLLQILRITGKTASLRVEGPDRGGTLYFDQGRIVDGSLAEGCCGDDPRDRIVETVYVLQLLPDGTFSVGSDVSPEPGEGMEVPEAMELAERHLAAERELAESGVIGSGSLQLTSQVEDPVTIPPGEWEVLARVMGTFSLSDLESALGRARAVGFIAGLRRLGLVDSADWDAPNGGGEDVRPPAEAEPTEHVVDDTPPEEGPTPDADGALPSWWVDQPEDGTGSPSAEVIELEALANTETDEQMSQERRREMRSLITPPDTTLVPGVLDDLRARFRTIEGDPAGS